MFDHQIDEIKNDIKSMINKIEAVERQLKSKIEKKIYSILDWKVIVILCLAAFILFKFVM